MKIKIFFLLLIILLLSSPLAAAELALSLNVPTTLDSQAEEAPAELPEVELVEEIAEEQEIIVEGPDGLEEIIEEEVVEELVEISTEPTVNIELDDNFIFDVPDVSAPGDTITIDCVVTSENWDPLGVKIVFGPGEQVYLKQVTENPKHWQGIFTLPGMLPEKEYSADFKILVATKNILTKKVKYNVERKVSGVIYTGNELIKGSLIEKEIMCSPGEYFNELKVESDMQRIYDLGYFLDVSYNVQRDVSGDLIIQYVLEENPVIDEIRLEGNTVFADYTILKDMQTKVGRILQNKELREDIQQIDKMYQDNQFILAKVKDIKRPLPGQKKKILYIEIEEGHVGTIKIRGNKNTKDKTILREMELKTGDVLDRDMLQADLRSVYNLNYFQNVYPDLRPRLDSSDIMDLTIVVEEKRTNSINFGGGYSQLDGWFGFVDLLLDNLWGEAQSLLMKAQFGQLRTSYQLRYHNPWWLPNRTSFTGKLWSTYGLNYMTGTTEQRGGWDLEFGKQLSRHVRGTFHTLYEDIYFPYNQEEDYFRRGVGVGLSYDTRDYIMNPTKGDYNVFRVDKFLPWLGGTVDSWKYTLSLQKFIPLEKVDNIKDPEAKVKQVWATRFLWNLAQGDVRESEEYYVGSDNTVRGYNRIFARGRKRWVINNEYRYLFNEIVQGVLFYDVGYAWDTLSDFINPDRYQTGKGVGVRLITPIGPIRLDMGWKEYAAFSEGFLHFSIGHAF